MHEYALKEWASVIAAMLGGEQVVMLRKGGVGEKRFEVPHQQFFLLPTHLHQRPELLVPVARDAYAHELGMRTEPGRVRLEAWCEVAAVHPVTEQAELTALKGFHILAADYARSRLKWRPTQPLMAVVVRVHRAAGPPVVDMDDAMGGCVSWVAMPAHITAPPPDPVLTDMAFARSTKAITDALVAARPVDSPTSGVLG